MRHTLARLFLPLLLLSLVLVGCDSIPAIQHHHPTATVAKSSLNLAPDFRLQNHDGQMVQLSQLRGQWVMLYFYPLSDTPSCACQANEFTGLIRTLKQVDALPLAISVDMADMVDVYRSKYQLPFTLLGDEDAKVTQSYGAWKGGLQNGITQRTAVLINPQGQIVYRMPVKSAKGTIESIQGIRVQYP